MVCFIGGLGDNSKAKPGFIAFASTLSIKVSFCPALKLCLSSENIVTNLPIHTVLLMPFPNTRADFQLDDVLELRFNQCEK